MYIPPYERSVWFYEETDSELNQRAINEFGWMRVLSKANLGEKVCYFSKTVINIIHNFILRARFVCDGRDPAWINNEIKNLINEKTSAYKSYCHCRFNLDVFLIWIDVFRLKKLKVLQNQLHMSIENSKQKYFPKLLSELAYRVTSSKTCWSILETFFK